MGGIADLVVQGSVYSGCCCSIPLLCPEVNGEPLQLILASLDVLSNAKENLVNLKMRSKNVFNRLSNVLRNCNCISASLPF
jgi:hypothetical protein